MIQSLLVLALVMVSTASMGEKAQQSKEVPVIQEPSGKQVAESLGYHTGPKGWEEVDRNDPWIQRRIKDRL